MWRLVMLWRIQSNRPGGAVCRGAADHDDPAWHTDGTRHTAVRGDGTKTGQNMCCVHHNEPRLILLK